MEKLAWVTEPVFCLTSVRLIDNRIYNTMSYAISVPYTNKTIVINCKCGTDSVLTWVRMVIKGWSLQKSICRNTHKRMRPAVHSGKIFGPTLFVVREPVSRIVSCYFDRINRPRAKTYHPTMTLSQFIDKLANRNYRYSDEHWRPQSHMLESIHDHNAVEYTLLSELELKLSRLLDEVDCPCPTLPNLKESVRRYEGNPLDHVDNDDVNKILSIYADDKELYYKARANLASQR